MTGPDTIPRLSLSRVGARVIVEHAMSAAVARNVSIAVVILDDAARMLVAEVMDGAPNAAFEVALAKARHAANFRRPTKVQEDLLLHGQWQVLAVPGMLPLEGGLPIQKNERVIGAIGISGAASTVDGEIAETALASVL